MDYFIVTKNHLFVKKFQKPLDKTSFMYYICNFCEKALQNHNINEVIAI